MKERLEKLKELLLSDRQALQDGNFSALQVTTAIMDGILSDLEASGSEKNEETRILLEQVQSLATRNASLLKAGIEGTKAAREKIEMIRRATSQLNTYTSDGSVEDVALRPKKIEKRA